MNKIVSKKLLNSKWTAVTPCNKEKHFIITKLEFDENDNVTHCLIEAVISNRTELINWKDLIESKYWQQGWN
jgi:tryptophan-rich hypothetical protein